MPDAVSVAANLVERVRARPWGLAVGAVVGDQAELSTDSGDDALSTTTLFQVGSITKTITGVLLAESVLRKELTLQTTLGEIFDETGKAKGITVLDLATQRSGLPRLPPNLDPGRVDPKDPYAEYQEADLLAALELIDEPAVGTYGYSNFGFMLLGLVLRRATGVPYGDLFSARVAEPLGLESAGCPPVDAGRAPGYAGSGQTPWWSTNLPGAGGVGMSIEDLTRYLRAHVDVDASPLRAAIELATTLHVEPPSGMGLGWGYQGGGWFHDGGTGGFSSFVAFFRPKRLGVALLANGGNVDLSSVGFAALTQLIRES